MYLFWKGDPLSYRRDKGTGLIVGRYNYLFDEEGRMESLQKLTSPILEAVVSARFDKPAVAMAAYARRRDPKYDLVNTEEQS